MTYPNYGIYEAIVTDNTNFFSTGKIRVRIQSFYNSEIGNDLTVNYNQQKFNKEIINDVDALVSTPMGGGSNYGLFILPQINAVGTVQFLNGNIKKPIWTGSYYNILYDENQKLLNVKIPNDQADYEGAGSEGIVKNSSGEVIKQINGDYGTVILRTKQTKSPGSSGESRNMDFTEQRTENLMSLSKDEFHFTHFSKWKMQGQNPVKEQWEELNLGTEKKYAANGTTVISEIPRIDLKVSEVNRSNQLKTVGIKVTNDEVALEVESVEDKLKSSISSTKDGININALNINNGNNTSIKMTPDLITLENKEVTILIEGNEVSISVPNGKLRLSGKEVLLGDGGGYVVIKDTPIPMRMEDGTILKTSNVRA